MRIVLLPKRENFNWPKLIRLIRTSLKQSARACEWIREMLCANDKRPPAFCPEGFHCREREADRARMVSPLIRNPILAPDANLLVVPEKLTARVDWIPHVSPFQFHLFACVLFCCFQSSTRPRISEWLGELMPGTASTRRGIPNASS